MSLNESATEGAEKAARVASAALTYLVQGWLAGVEGFPPTHTFAIVTGEVLNAVWMTWLLVVGWRMPESEPASLRR